MYYRHTSYPRSKNEKAESNKLGPQLFRYDFAFGVCVFFRRKAFVTLVVLVSGVSLVVAAVVDALLFFLVF